MGVGCVVVRLNDETIDELLATPRKAWHFYSPDDPREPETVSFLARLFGRKPIPYPTCSSKREFDDFADLDKSWDALDFLISDGWKIPGIARLLTTDGEIIRQEIGFGNPRAFRSTRVKEFNQLLSNTSDDILRGRYIPSELTKAKVYPVQIWSGHNEFDQYLQPNYRSLKRLIAQAVERSQGVVIFQV